MTPTRDMKHACIKRELHMRGRVYPHRVAEGRMTQADSDHEIAVMQAILADYTDPDLFGAEVAA